MTPAVLHVHEIALRVCGCSFIIECRDSESAALMISAFGGLSVWDAAPPSGATTRYRIDRDHSGRGFCVTSPAGGVVRLDHVDDLLFHIDKCLTLALQHQRPDLYFLHAAAVAFGGRVAVLAAPAGTGKSTLTLALLQDQFAYLSDELAPVDVRRMTVHPYAHALCLKAPPPEPYHTPSGTLHAGGRLHVPVGALRAVHTTPGPLAAFIFVRRTATPPVCRPITAASAAAHLMANALNPLAHGSDGLDVAVALSQRVPSFEIDSADLPAACAAVLEILDQPCPRPGPE